MTAYEILSSALVQDAAELMNEQTPLICLRAERDRLCRELIDGIYLQSREPALIEADLEHVCSRGEYRSSAETRIRSDIKASWGSTQGGLFESMEQLLKLVGLIYTVERREVAELLAANPRTR